MASRLLVVQATFVQDISAKCEAHGVEEVLRRVVGLQAVHSENAEAISPSCLLQSTLFHLKLSRLRTIGIVCDGASGRPLPCRLVRRR